MDTQWRSTGVADALRWKPFTPRTLLVLSGAGIREPILADGPVIMNQRSQIDAAFARYRAGEMGHLAPLSEG